MRIDPLKALTPVVQLSRQPVVLAVHPSLGSARSPNSSHWPNSSPA